MAKKKTLRFGNREYTDEELVRMFEESDSRGKEVMSRELRAKRVRYDTKSRRLVIDLESGTTIILPLHQLDEFEGASPQEMAAVELRPRGAALHWVKLDLDFSVAGIMAAAIGTGPVRYRRRRRAAS